MAAALATAGAWLRDELKIDPIAIGHRVVHGGPDYDRPVRVDQDVLARLERYVSLAPLHQPYNLAPIRSILARFPDLPQVACFDTAFHRGHGALADHYAIPRALHAEGVRRYGFHGLSYEYIASVLPRSRAGGCEQAGDRRPSRQRRLDVRPQRRPQRRKQHGLHRARRTCRWARGRGQIDPGVVLYLISEKGMAPADVQNFLYQECGLKGLSGISNDMRRA